MRASFTQSSPSLAEFIRFCPLTSLNIVRKRSGKEEEGGGRRRRRRQRKREVPQRIPNEEKKKYIVTLKSRYESLRLCKLNKQLNCKKIFRSGFTVNAAESELERLNELEDIEDIEEDVVVSKMSYDAVPWHLDRIDQNYLPLDNQFVIGMRSDEVHREVKAFLYTCSILEYNRNTRNCEGKLIRT